MRLSGQVVRILGAMIVVIVAFLGSSVAQAHPGPDHAPKPAVSAPVAASATAKAAHEAAGKLKRIEYAVVATASRPGQNGNTQPDCGDLCCSTSSGSACCGSALLAGSGIRLLHPRVQMLVPMAGAAELTSIVPEALPEPPKFFA